MKNDLGELLKRWRTEAGLSQEAAGKRVDVSQGRWADWEHGNVKPGVGTLAKLAEVTKFSLQQLVHAGWPESRGKKPTDRRGTHSGGS
jgi:transcriptional regulator with XRE-family HTH domain